VVVAYPKQGPPTLPSGGLVDGDTGCAAAGGLPLVLLGATMLRRRLRREGA